ncbi:MAG: hypothetical protein J5803_01050 [Desulfovibrio sp.]|nr:hypothetical protein [Desulfovibrio sp.]
MLTRALRVFGVDIGVQHLARRDNPKGFFEQIDFVHLNEALFEALGLHWDSLETPSFAVFSKAACAQEFVRKARAFLRDFCHEGVVGLKDPRLCRLLPFWLPLFSLEGLAVSCLIALRAPDHIAASLAKRDGLTLQHASDLWTLYMGEAILMSQGLPRLLLCYDSFFENAHDELERIASFLKLPILPEEESLFYSAFLDHSLRHHTSSSQGYCEEARHARAFYTFLMPLMKEPDARLLESPSMEGKIMRLLQRVQNNRVRRQSLA